jgi:hypothetical protein
LEWGIAMAFENFAVQRLILHEVYRRRDDGQVVQPTYGGQLLQLPAQAMDAFKERVVDALGNHSQSMEMTVEDCERGSAIDIASTLLKSTDGAFVGESQKYADRLASVQVSRILPGGILAVFTGTVGATSHPYVGIIKAETQSGFSRTIRRGTIDARFLDDLFLTPAAKLYKIGMFVREGAARSTLPQGWRAIVYDSHMTARNREGAARYFFGLFLGCEIPANSAILTKSFFENTREFIRGLDVPAERKADLLTSLYTYLKVDQTPTIEVNTFSNTYIPTESRDPYRTFMAQRDFPTTAVQKDISDITNMLKLRKVAFQGGIKLTAPPEAFRDLIQIETIPQDGARPGQPSSWTRITIRDQIREQE